MRSATTGLRLCGIADEPFWPLPNGSATSATSVRARCRISSANFSSEAATSASADEQLGMPVPLDDLRRDRVGLQPEALAGEPLQLGVGRRVGADRARELADAHRLERPRQPRARAVELEGPAGELEPEGRRLGVHAVRPPDADVVAVLAAPARPPRPARARAPRAAARRPRAPAARAPVSTMSDEVSPWWIQRPAGPTSSATASTNAARSCCVSRSSSATRSGSAAARAPGSRPPHPAGSAPSSAQASRAASSTSSQRASLLSSDQTPAISGRE